MTRSPAPSVRTAAPIWLTSREADRRFPTLVDSPTFGNRFAVLPLSVKGEVLGVLALGFEHEGDFEPHERAFFLAVTEQVAQAFDRARLRALEARITRDNAFLIDAAAALSESLDYTATLANIVRLLVPGLADLATIHLFDGTGRLRRVALAHRSPEIEAAIRAAGDDEHPAAFLADVASSGTLFIKDAKAMSDGDRVSRETVASLAPLHIQSAVVVPLGSGTEHVGVLSVASVDAAGRFDAIFVSLLEDLAQRAAVAIENSRLHSDLQAARRGETFLLDVANALARADGYEETLDRLAGVAVPTLGDLCLIDVLDDDGWPRRMVAHHADPSKQHLADRLRRWPPDPSGGHPSVNVIRTGRSLWAEGDDRRLPAGDVPRRGPLRGHQSVGLYVLHGRSLRPGRGSAGVIDARVGRVWSPIHR